MMCKVRPQHRQGWPGRRRWHFLCNTNPSILSGAVRGGAPWVRDMKVVVRQFPFFVAYSRAYTMLDLEKRRSEILAQISALGDFRPGSISATRGRCGNPNCHCHKPDDPGHGPNLRLTYKVKGKTVTESFPNPAAQRKVEREIAGFRRFQELSGTLIETNEMICRARPLEDTLSPQEKKRRKRFGKKSKTK